MFFYSPEMQSNACKTLSKLTWLNYILGGKVQQNIKTSISKLRKVGFKYQIYCKQCNKVGEKMDFIRAHPTLQFFTGLAFRMFWLLITLLQLKMIAFSLSDLEQLFIPSA